MMSPEQNIPTAAAPANNIDGRSIDNALTSRMILEVLIADIHRERERLEIEQGELVAAQ